MDEECLQKLRSQVKGIGANISVVIERSKATERENRALRGRVEELEARGRIAKRVTTGTQTEPAITATFGLAENSGLCEATDNDCITSKANNCRQRVDTCNITNPKGHRCPISIGSATSCFTCTPSQYIEHCNSSRSELTSSQKRHSVPDGWYIGLASRNPFPDYQHLDSRIIRRTPAAPSDLGNGLGFFLS